MYFYARLIDALVMLLTKFTTYNITQRIRRFVWYQQESPAIANKSARCSASVAQFIWNSETLYRVGHEKPPPPTCQL